MVPFLYDVDDLMSDITPRYFSVGRPRIIQISNNQIEKRNT
jgi:hypothetical protein